MNKESNNIKKAKNSWASLGNSINIIAGIIAILSGLVALIFWASNMDARLKFLEQSQAQDAIPSLSDEQIEQINNLVGKHLPDTLDLPIGTILPILNRNILTELEGEWLLCDGESIETSKYSELAEALGEGKSANFQLPNLEGRVLRGKTKNEELGELGGENSIDYSRIFRINEDIQLKPDDGGFSRGEPTSARYDHAHTLELIESISDNNVPAYLAVEFFIRVR